MGVNQELWAGEIAKNLYKGIEFVEMARNDDAYMANAVVHLPQSGGKPDVKRDRAVWPMGTVQRGDSIISYPTPYFSSQATAVQKVETLELSYDKVQDVTSDHISQLRDSVADYFSYRIAPNDASRIFDTTGAGRDSSFDGTTGQRQSVTRKDIKRLLGRLNADLVPKQGRVLILNHQAEIDLLDDDKLTSKDYVQTYNMETGSVARLWGFEVYVTGDLGAYVGTTPKDPEAAVQATDQAFCLAYHRDFVRRGKGGVLPFINENDANWQGDIMSFGMHFGASRARADWRGIAALREATTA